LRLAVAKSSSSALTALARVAWPWLALERVAWPQATLAGGALTPATLAWEA
jgi:DNA-binding helix-hairpin-helix protein with protein kinase domain